eukprot:365619-Chlamydomonas_euryale.AAC.18
MLLATFEHAPAALVSKSHQHAQRRGPSILKILKDTTTWRATGVHAAAVYFWLTGSLHPRQRRGGFSLAAPSLVSPLLLVSLCIVGGALLQLGVIL